MIDEYEYYYDEGVDGVFTEHPSSAINAFEYLAQRKNQNANDNQCKEWWYSIQMTFKILNALSY